MKTEKLQTAVQLIRGCLVRCLTILLSTLPGMQGLAPSMAADRPNIMWITSEDNSPYLGCYGDSLAHTPHLDRLAAKGVRYRHAFANAPVCSTARTTLITGMYASSLGAHNHRSRVAIPASFELYPEVMRSAGYYCTNNAKTDYNLTIQRQVWDDSSNRAHYRNRAENQPFFAVFNFTTSHESRVAPKRNKEDFRVSPEAIQLPPYHPDTTAIRRDWANYYDQITAMDAEVGELLKGLEQAGLADNTIVFYYSDHGGGLPRGKRSIHDSGTRVPLIIRFPDKWSHLAPAEPGEWIDELVSFVDLPATVMSMCNVAIPANYQGRPFLGAYRSPPREQVYLLRGRMDERYDTIRAVRTSQFRYIRNYAPHRPWGQYYAYPFEVLPSMRSWYDEFAAGRCNPVQAAYWQRKPGEELYHLASDPFEIANSIDAPQFAADLQNMRSALFHEMLATRDIGLIPEGMIDKLAGEGTIYEYAQSTAYPLERILETADMASDGRLEHLPKLLAALNDTHPVIRYWAATGCLILGQQIPLAERPSIMSQLKSSLDDTWHDVRVVAAETLGLLGESEQALTTLGDVLEHGNSYEVLAAQNSLDFMWQAGTVTLAQAQELVRNRQATEPLDRIPRYLLSRE